VHGNKGCVAHLSNRQLASVAVPTIMLQQRRLEQSCSVAVGAARCRLAVTDLVSAAKQRQLQHTAQQQRLASC
jgi:hypothetical protein